MNKLITIGWLYPTLMNVYGDIGNVKTIQKRLEWRSINSVVKYLDPGFSSNELKNCDILLMGGAQDKQQEIVSSDLSLKRDYLREMIEKETPGLYVCGAYQFLGNFYKKSDGKIIKGLEIFDLYTENFDDKRLTGNVIAKSEEFDYLVGFENHGGKTYLGKKIKPLASIISGFGNNGDDKTEGAIYKNSIGTYLHGPVLPKNPKLTDYLIEIALVNKYKTKILLTNIDDTNEKKARLTIAKKLKVTI